MSDDTVDSRHGVAHIRSFRSLTACNRIATSKFIVQNGLWPQLTSLCAQVERERTGRGEPRPWRDCFNNMKLCRFSFFPRLFPLK